jgi:hypothetical protein
MLKEQQSYFVVVLLLLLQRVRTTSYNHSGTYNCQNIEDPAYQDTIGPNFYGVPPATNAAESKSRLKDREYQILSHYAQLSLPLNSSSDDYVGKDESIKIKDNVLLPTNPYFNSRNDTTRLVARMISRITLGCYNNTDFDDIVLDKLTRPFSIPGFSQTSGPCFRDGDYDFATIDILQLLYVSREYPGSLTNAVYTVLRDNMLTIYGRISGVIDPAECTLEVGPISTTIAFELVATENHVLQTEISRYLTNQLLLEVYPNESEYNNTLNGNKQWMLEHLSTFFRTYFYEFNSRPYQTFTVKALSVLHSHAQDDDIVLACEMLLDIITAYSCLQMNRLRRFPPFRRQPEYVNRTKSRDGDGEFYRLSVLVGDYTTLDGTNYTLPGEPGNIYRSLGNINLVSTVASKYRISDGLLDVFFNTDPLYFIGLHDVVEMYYSTKAMVISAGGNSVSSRAPNITFPNLKCIFPSCKWKRVGSAIIRILASAYATSDELERGLARPTTIVSSNERSMDLLDMIRFDGHREFDEVSRSRNLCVGPGFACGLQFQYGNVLKPVIDDCSVVIGDWRFFDLSNHTTGGSRNSLGSTCPKYGYYMAVYVSECIECVDQADNYGLLEIYEETTNLTFDKFQQTVRSNNPTQFSSEGIHVYTTISGQRISFEIDPRNYDQSQIIQVSGIGNRNALALDRNYNKWPLAWSATSTGNSTGRFISSSSALGRWTFDFGPGSTDDAARRCIYDVTDPLQPRRILSQVPILTQHPIDNQDQYPIRGRYFDDSSSVIENDSVQSFTFYYTLLGVTGFRMVWRSSGLQSIHGSIDGSGRRVVTYPLEANELIVEVGIGTATLLFGLGPRRVNRVRIVTNRNREIIVGYGRTEQTVYKNDALSLLNIIAFHGRDDDGIIYQLGVVSM